MKYDKHLVHFSTCEVYGRTLASYGLPMSDEKNYILDEDTSPMIMGPVSAQRWCYACAKQLVERLIYAHGTENNLKFTIVRPYNWICPRMDYVPGVDGKDDGQPRVLASFMTALMKGDPLILVNGGEVRPRPASSPCPLSHPSPPTLPTARFCASGTARLPVVASSTVEGRGAPGVALRTPPSLPPSSCPPASLRLPPPLLLESGVHASLRMPPRASPPTGLPHFLLRRRRV